MLQAKVRPDLVLCSSATRAVQTYEGISAGLGSSVAVSVEDDLYGASDTGLLVRLQDVPENVGSVLVSGTTLGFRTWRCCWPAMETCTPWPGWETTSRRAPSPPSRCRRRGKR